MSRPRPALNANHTQGRILLALRAGRMTYGALAERFPSGCHYLAELERVGRIAQADGYFALTAAGKQACPSRRAAPLEPLHGGLSTLSSKERAALRQGEAA